MLNDPAVKTFLFVLSPWVGRHLWVKLHLWRNKILPAHLAFIVYQTLSWSGADSRHDGRKKVFCRIFEKKVRHRIKNFCLGSRRHRERMPVQNTCLRESSQVCLRYGSAYFNIITGRPNGRPVKNNCRLVRRIFDYWATRQIPKIDRNYQEMEKLPLQKLQ